MPAGLSTDEQRENDSSVRGVGGAAAVTNFVLFPINRNRNRQCLKR